VVEAGQAGGIEVSVCGEMASEPLSALLLVGLGYSTLSVSPPALPRMKALVRKVPMAACREAADRAMLESTADEILIIAREVLQRHLDLRLFESNSVLQGRSSGASLQP
jgi:phosphotransferase system enzyme I (PtsP)